MPYSYNNSCVPFGTYVPRKEKACSVRTHLEISHHFSRQVYIQSESL